MLKLTGIAFSPWSEKAKWALDHHRVPYQYEEYIPFAGEILLRLRMRRPTGIVSVPVAYDGARWLTDSLDIAKYAERTGFGAPLFPEGKVREIELWNARSEAALAAGRALAVLLAARDPNTARAMLPKPVRSILGPLAEKGLNAFIDKYRMRENFDQHERTLHDGLAKMESALGEHGTYLVGDSFSYADIAMALVVQFVVPVDRRYMPAAPPGVEWTENPPLAKRWKNLVAWRDALYEKHRRA